MTTPISLNKARKAKARSTKEQAASENRARFGRTKAERTLEAKRAEKLAKLSDGHRLDSNLDEQG